MSQKNVTPTSPQTKPEGETQAEPTKPTKAPSSAPNSEPSNAAKASPSDKGSLPTEIIDLVAELRDTVKSLNPRRHTAKTLRRSLATVNAILADIEKLLP